MRNLLAMHLIVYGCVLILKEITFVRPRKKVCSFSNVRNEIKVSVFTCPIQHTIGNLSRSNMQGE